MALAAQTVPFVGCAADGQTGPQAAPKGAAVRVALPARAAAELAYYKGAMGTAVLAPRGWQCLEIFGSSGNGLVVRPGAVAFGEDVHGPAVIAELRYGDTSGRFSVARAIARVFPNVRFLDDEGQIVRPVGPYSTGVLRRRGDRIVLYRTPARMEGLGTESWFKKDDQPIDGAVALVGETPNPMRVNVRLPERLRWLAPLILEQALPK